jgi:TPR repeat protein
MAKKQFYNNLQKEKLEKETIVPPVPKSNLSNHYIYLLITVLGFVIYGNSLKNDYALDDRIVLTDNVFTQKGISGIADIFKYDTFTGCELVNKQDKTPKQVQEEMKFVAGGRYRPLSVATLAIEVSFFGKEITNAQSGKTYLGNPLVSHLINLMIYILTTCLLFKILSTFFPQQLNQKWFLSLPFIATLLFLCHPVHTEAIANVKGRDEIMTLLGSLGALWFSIVYCRNKKTYNLLLSGICLFLGLLSKENAITFLCVIPISLYLFAEKKLKTILIACIPLIAASVIFLLIRGQVLGFAQPKFITNEVMNDPFIYATFSQKYGTIFYTLWLYIKLLIFPHPLTHDYYPVQIAIIDFANPKAFIPFLLYSFLAFYAIYTVFVNKKNPVVSWSIWVFLLPLSVVSNLFFSVGTFMNERFIFISSIGFCVILAWLLSVLIPKYLNNRKSTPTIISVIVVIILCFYAGKTMSRNLAWKNDYVLYTTDVKVSSNSARCNRYAGEYIIGKAKLLKDEDTKRNKLYQQAIAYLEKSAKLYPGGKHTDVLFVLGDAYYNYDFDIPNSLKSYAKCLHYDSYIHKAIYHHTQIVAKNTSAILSESKTQSTPQEILKACDEVLQAVPDFGEIIHLKAVLYGKYLHDFIRSIQLFEEAHSIEKFEKSSEFFNDMGMAYALAHNNEKALLYLLKSVELGNSDARAFKNIAGIYQRSGDLRNAHKYLILAQEMEASR